MTREALRREKTRPGGERIADRRCRWQMKADCNFRSRAVLRAVVKQARKRQMRQGERAATERGALGPRPTREP